MIRKRELVTCILLTIFTCGIYGLVWMYQLTEDVAALDNKSGISGGAALLLTIITCGIYGIYWSYKMGQEVYKIKLEKNMYARDNSILYVVLDILGFAIVNYCLIQSDLNEIAEA